jgi:flagella basal body P-ring formation protein FlgA
MRHRALWLAQIILMQVGPAAGTTACQVIDGDRIHASDVAVLVPAFAALNPAAEIGLAPLPGIKRVFHLGDLLQLAHSRGIQIEAPQATLPSEICFERRAGERPGTGHPAQAAAATPPAVKRGDKVAVSVTTGSVLLTFESEAESSGRVGDTVIVRNPTNGNRFVAQVQNPGKVIVNK